MAEKFHTDADKQVYVRRAKRGSKPSAKSAPAKTAAPKAPAKTEAPDPKKES